MRYRTDSFKFQATLIGLLACSFISSPTFSEAPPLPVPPKESSLLKFVDKLPIPPILRIGPDTHEVTIHLTQFKHRFHRDLPPAATWGYNGKTPGPSIDVESGNPLRVHWQNDLPKKHILPMTSGMGAMGMGLPESRAVTHLHGAFVTEPDQMNRLNNNDGWPDAWTIGGQTQIAEYPNQQEAATLWYHDHSIGITGRNVYAGLEGFYFVHDSFERSLRLPKGKFEIPLMIQGRSFDSDGSMIYPRGIPLEVYGNTLTVNGVVWPFLNLEPRLYRLRLLNASNARSLALRLADQKTGGPGPKFIQIGSDGGFLESPVFLNDPQNTEDNRLQLASGERADILVDFSKFPGKDLKLDNNAVPDDLLLGPKISDVMLFRVGKKVSSPATSKIPTELRPIKRLKEAEAVISRRIVLSETDSPDGSQMMLLNDLHWGDPVAEKPVLGTTEIWELVNTTDDNHPFHIHSVQFQVLDRHPFDVERFKKDKELIWKGTPKAPNPNERGWKDTLVASPGNVTRLIVKFDHFAGHYVYHCHILEHEDMDMMRPFEVVEKPK